MSTKAAIGKLKRSKIGQSVQIFFKHLWGATLLKNGGMDHMRFTARESTVLVQAVGIVRKTRSELGVGGVK